MFNLKPRLPFKHTNPTYMVGRSPDVQAAYDKVRRRRRARYGDDAPCLLCDDEVERTVVRDMGTMVVVNNDFPYARYDGLIVAKHLLLMPKRHISTFGEFTEQEREDYWSAHSQLSDGGVNIMTRGAYDARRSIPDHLHTHLLYYQD